MGRKKIKSNKDSIYDMTLILLWNLISAVKTLQFCHNVLNIVMDVRTFPEICTILLHGVISLPDWR